MPGSSEPTPPITSALSPDLDAVGRFIREMIARGAIAALVTAVVALLVRMRDLNLELVRAVAGKSRKRPPNEAMRRLQLELPLVFAAAANDTTSTKPPPVGTPPANDEKKKGKRDRLGRDMSNRDEHGRPVFPAHLPRIPNVLRVPEAERRCPHCKTEVERIALEPTAEKLTVKPVEFVVEQIQRETCACPKCHRYVITAPKPDEVVDRGILGNELLVQAMVDHYEEAVPYERMERLAAQQGVPLAANTLAASVGRLVDLFDPIVRHVREACFSSTYQALDATSIRVLDPEHPLGVRTGALWLITGAHRYACFVYAPSAEAEHLEALFAGRSLGSVMCDGSATNNCVDRAGARRGGCNAHARRKLVEALRLGDARAVEGLSLYAGIFHVDAESLRLGESAEARFARRQTDAAPLVAKLREWVDRQRGEVEPKTPLGRALGYMHRQWKRLTEFLRDPLMDLTNNEVERDLRRWVLDRKVWMFVGHDASARRAADALTIITTCKKFGIEPRSYVRDTLAKLLAGEKRLEALLPENYVATRAASTGARADAAA
jgi:transposase